jgi:hypothetical protein
LGVAWVYDEITLDLNFELCTFHEECVRIYFLDDILFDTWQHFCVTFDFKVQPSKFGLLTVRGYYQGKLTNTSIYKNTQLGLGFHNLVGFFSSHLREEL